MKTVFKIQSTVTLKSGDALEQEDFVLVVGGLRTAIEKVRTHHMKLRYRDHDGEWSDVVQVDAHHGGSVCDLTVK